MLKSPHPSIPRGCSAASHRPAQRLLRTDVGGAAALGAVPTERGVAVRCGVSATPRVGHPWVCHWTRETGARAVGVRARTARPDSDSVSWGWGRAMVLWCASETQLQAAGASCAGLPPVRMARDHQRTDESSTVVVSPCPQLLSAERGSEPWAGVGTFVSILGRPVGTSAVAEESMIGVRRRILSRHIPGFGIPHNRARWAVSVIPPRGRVRGRV